jgi:type I restriction enzyme S subunit
VIGFGNEPNLVFALTFRQCCREVPARRRHGGLGISPASAFVIQMLCLRQRRHRRRWYLKGADNTPYEKIGDEVRSLAGEVPFEIPDSWEWARLGSVVYNRGQTSPSTEFCYIDIGSIDNKNQKLNPTDTTIAPDKAPSRARKLVDMGDILYSTVRPYLHNMCIIDREFPHIPIASTGFAVLTCHANLLNKYLFYYLMSPDFDAYANNTDNAKGVAYPAINDDRLYKALIPIPPVAEQHRIVSAIDSVNMPLCEYGGKEETLRILNTSFPENLKKSILQEAVQGKLVPQDLSDEPAEALLERIRVEKQRLIKEGKVKKDKRESVIFRRDNSHYEKLDGVERCIDDELPFEIPKSWAWVRFSDIAVFENGDRSSRYPVESDYVPDGIPFFGAKDMGEKYMEYSSVRFITPQKFEELGNGKLKDGDFVCLLRGNVGKTRIYKENEKYHTGFICAQMLIIRCIESSIQKYVYTVINSQYYCRAIESKITGTAVRQLPAKEVANILVPLPPLAEQRRIVQRIEELLPLVKGL